MSELRRPFDLAKPASNGLRRGYTTGTCAAAAVKAALYHLLHRTTLTEVEVSLPDKNYYLSVPVHAVGFLEPETAFAEIIKYAGDDPDATDGATIFAHVTVNGTGKVQFIAGAGVGTVTQPGLRVSIGEPAINPVPRLMMRQAVEEVLEGATNLGFDLIIGCKEGEAIAPKTFNPRLGIIGGISILGTSGIVEPMSLSAWIASIETYVRVALGDNPSAIAFTPGKIGKNYAREVLGLSDKQVVQIANFMGASLDFVQQTLEAESRRLETLWILGHPGKIAKVLDNVWDTHSGKSGMAMQTVAAVARACSLSNQQILQIEKANTVENIIELLQGSPASSALWIEVERQVSRLMQARLSRVDRVEVRLFAMNGAPIGAAA